MVKRLYDQDLGRVDLVPQAIIKRSVRDLERDTALSFEREEDDLNEYHAAYFRTQVGVAALIHHDGEPDDSITVYLPRTLTSQEIDRAISKILETLKIPESFLSWREKTDLRR